MFIARRWGQWGRWGQQAWAWAQAWTLACTLIVGPGLAAAASLGSPVLGGAGAVMGQPLDFALPVRLEAGEQIGADCVGAEIVAGEHLIPAYELRVSLEVINPELLRLRVLTLQAIKEVALTVVVKVGCPPARQTRRFVILVEPESSPGVPSALPVASPSVLPSVLPPVLPPALPPVRGPELLAAQAAAAPATSATAPTKARPAPVARRVPASVRNDVAKGIPRRTPNPVPAAANSVAQAMPRLRLENLEPPAAGASSVSEAVSPPQGSTALSTEAAATALAAEAMSVAASAVDRSVRLEQQLVQSRADLRSSREQVAQLRERLAQDQQAAGWAWPLLLLATLLAGVSLWLGRRVLQLQVRPATAAAEQPLDAVDTHAQPDWSPSRNLASAERGLAEQQTRSRLATAPVPFVQSAVAAPPGNAVQPGLAAPSANAWPEPSMPHRAAAMHATSAALAAAAAHEAATPEAPMAITQPLSQGQRDLRSGSRDVSIEELIDLEQQAEFFIVLGQDEAAIDLLVDHLRGTGGSSPLPYLKLLEIYHRRADEMAYERTRARFNHRFNAVAPAWGSDLAHGKDLESYAGVLPRLMQVWPRPLDAMAELEALLFRKSRGDLFELPAYREVLFLYALARDLLDREAADSGNVDLLLPLADGSSFGSTAPLPFQLPTANPQAATAGLRTAYNDADGAASAAALAHAAQADSNPDDRPTAPLDFDLSAPTQHSSIFDGPMSRAAPTSLR